MGAAFKIDCGKFGRLVVESSEKGLTLVTLEGEREIKDGGDGFVESTTLQESGISIRRIGAEELLRLVAASNTPVMAKEETPEALCKRAAYLIAAYLSGDDTAWGRIAALPVDEDALKGAFVSRVLLLLRHVPSGCYITYGDMANAAGNPKGARAVGNAMASNPLLIVVPCHRVYGSEGRFTGFGGGLGLKAALAALEQ